MSASGVGLFQDDVAADVRSAYLELLTNGMDDADAFKSMVREWKDSIADVDDGPVFWLALAATQWEYGRLHPRAKSQALKIIDERRGIDRWSAAGLAKRRDAVLVRLKKKLLSPQPKRRTPRRRFDIQPQPVSVRAPDGKAEATACFLGMALGQPLSQVFVIMKVKRSEGGGGVFAVYCPLADIGLEWLNGDSLQISYPRQAKVEQQKTTLFYSGRTISVQYRQV